MIKSEQRWLTAIPMTYTEEGGFWDRDAGLLCLGFRERGIHCRFVAWGEPGAPTDKPLILCRSEQMKDPAWWQQWKADAVALNSWAAPRFEPIARAVKESGAKLVVRLDSDGLKSPRGNFWRFFHTVYHASKDARRPLPPLYAVASTLAMRLAGSAYDQRVCKHMGHADILAIESPLARQRLARFLRVCGHPELVDRLRVVLHPAKVGAGYQASRPKKPQIIAVGRWESAQKDAPRLMQVLALALPRFPDYTAVLVGSGTDLLERLRGRLSAAVQPRIQILGKVEHARLAEHYLESQVMLFSSRYEGFPLAAAEALCHGCTVAGPTLVPALNYICSLGAGTPAMTRSRHDLAEALGAEIDAWRSGERDPAQISRQWQDRVSPSAIACRLLNLVAPG